MSEMPSHAPLEIRLSNRVIDYADERAAFFFVSNLSSVGTAAYDRWVNSPQNPPDQLVRSDVRAINTTMMARTAYKHWEQFTGSAEPLGWLQELAASWDLFTMSDEAWTTARCEMRILAALTAVLGPYRTTSITTKLLHLKRPNLIPICDSYVCSMLGKHPGDAVETTKLIMAVRELGRANLDVLMEISKRLTSIGINRTLVRILDSLLWSAYRTGGPEAEFPRWLVRWHKGRLFF
jgi:Family of unknown function (DUF6308)